MKPVAIRLRALVFRLEPNQMQEEFMSQIGDCCRYVFNWALDYRDEAWLAARSAGATGIGCSLRYNHLAGHLGQLREKCSFLEKAPYHCLQQALKDLDNAFERFFSGENNYPKFRKKGQWTPSFRFPDSKQFQINGQAIKLPKLGWVKIRRHGQRIPGKLKHITVKRVMGKWQCALLVEEKYSLPIAPTGPAIGLDVGVAHSLAIASADGQTELISLPVATVAENRALRRMARNIARRRQGSRRRSKALLRRMRYQRHILCRVMDVRHKLTTALAKKHGLIAFEAMNLKSMTRSARGTVESPGKNVRLKTGLNRVLLEQGIGETRRQLRYKALWNGGKILEVNAAYSSQNCSHCGHVSPKSRPSRECFVCIACGHAENADINAARNHLRAAQEIAQRGGTAVPARGGPLDRGCRSENLPGQRTTPFVSPDPGIQIEIAQAILVGRMS